MAGYKIDRLCSDVKFELSDIFRSLKDPRVTKHMITIVRVELTNDLSYAKVYVDAVEGIDAAKEAVKGLVSAAGYIRRELGSRVKMRKVPELKFVADDSIAHSAHIAKMLDDMKTQEEDNN